MTQRNERGQFLQGISGNPQGRGKGSRNKLGEDFLRELQADFAEHGAATIKLMRAERPGDYIKVVASLLPAQTEIHVTGLARYTDEQLDEILALCDRLESAAQGRSNGEGGQGEPQPPGDLQAVH